LGNIFIQKCWKGVKTAENCDKKHQH
jgi:hypothetical protein